MHIEESGITKYLGENYLKKNIDQCVIRNIEAQPQNGPLSLFAMTSAFVILGFGVGMSLLVFGFEFVVFWLGRRLMNSQKVKPQISQVPTGIEIENMNATDLINSANIILTYPVKIVENAVMESTNSFEFNKNSITKPASIPGKLVETAVVESLNLVK